MTGIAEGTLITLGASENDNSTDAETVGSTGLARHGDIFTDFTTNARTIYPHSGDTGVKHTNNATSDSASGETNGNNAFPNPHDTMTAPALSFPGTLSMVNSSVLRLNGQERFAERTSAYFNRVQPYQHHTGCPSGGVYVYSFALNPEKHQPSGTCNFSRIDNATLELTLKEPTNVDDVSTMEIFAHGYNVLRIMSGMGGLAYSN